MPVVASRAFVSKYKSDRFLRCQSETVPLDEAIRGVPQLFRGFRDQ
jgi:hypothetical protein